MVYYITIVKPTYNWSAPTLYANNHNFGIWHTLYHSNWSKRSGGIGGAPPCCIPVDSYDFPQHGWIVFGANGRWLVHPIPAFFLPAANRPVLQIATRGLFLDFCHPCCCSYGHSYQL